MNDMQRVHIGDRVTRTEDFRFVTGHGTYVDDLRLDGMTHAAVVRSPHAHAEIKGIDTSMAMDVPGVLLIVTGEDWQQAGYGPIPSKSAVNKFKDGSPMKEPPRHCLAIGRARYIGEPVALVVAETGEAARQAADLVDVDYDELPAVTEIAQAVAEGAPLVHDIAPGNICLDFELGDADAVEQAFAASDRVIEFEIANNRVTATPIEPRGAVAEYDPETDKFTLHNSSQNIHANRDQIAELVLKIDKDKLHHIAPDVGGGFGVKNAVYQEPILILHAARELKRPVKWINDRSESFLSDSHGRGQVAKVTLGLMNDGIFKALRTDCLGHIGAYCNTIGPFTPTGGSARTQGGPYAFEAMYYSAKAVFTNTAPLDPYRGAGRPEATFQTERIVELAARELGLDPVDIRRKNLIPPDRLPMKSAMNLDIDCGDFPRVFEMCLEMTDRAGYPKRVEESQAKGKLRGFAICPYLECTGGGPKEHCGMMFESDGKLTISVGSHSTGMGHETVFAQLAAAELGLDMSEIAFRQGDTDATPIGGGHGGSRGMEMGANAVKKTVGEVIEKAKVIAAHRFEADVETVDFADGHFTIAGTNHTMSIKEVIAASFDKEHLPADMEPGVLNLGTVFERGVISIPNGCHAAEVEVDPETGEVHVDKYWAVDDVGPVLNPLTCDGQVMGGVAQGIGQALLEEVVYDPESGQLVTGSLMDYALPRADHIPNMEIAYYEDAPTKKNPLGVKGVGEAGCVGGPPPIVNAVLDALKDLGVRHIDMPLTPQKVWRAVRDAGR